MILIVGYERKTGEFTPEGSNTKLSYDNIMIHILNDDCGIDGFVGSSCEQLKVKAKDVPKVFGCTCEDLLDFIGCPVNLVYSLVGGRPTLNRIVKLDVPGTNSNDKGDVPKANSNDKGDVPKANSNKGTK